MGTTVTVGIDLGGTKVATALVEANGNVVTTGRATTGIAADPQATVTTITANVKDICASLAEVQVIGVGVGAAGQIDPATGTVRSSPNLPGWNNVPLQAELQQALRLPVVVVNDVQAAAWGEWRYGAGQGVTDMVCLFVGTGIGGGVIAAGGLLAGCGGSAGELGHTVIERNGPECRCGNRGHLEATAGGWAIAQRASEAVVADPEAGATLLALAKGNGDELTAAHVSQAAHQGDPLAQRLVTETGDALSVGIASLVNAFNPCLVVLGGGVVEGLPELVEMAQERVPRYALAAAVEPLRITKAALGEHAGVIGAAALAWERFGDAAPAGGRGS